MQFCAVRLCPGRGPHPSRSLLDELIDQLADTLNGGNFLPIEAAAESWPWGNGCFVARLTVTCTAGSLAGSFRRWYAWQHKTFRFSPQPPPTLDAARVHSLASP